jgi:hypothetical protein
MNHEYTQEEDEAWNELSKRASPSQREELERDSKRIKSSPSKPIDLPNNDLND